MNLDLELFCAWHWYCVDNDIVCGYCFSWHPGSMLGVMELFSLSFISQLPGCYRSPKTVSCTNEIELVSDAVI